MEIDEIKIDRCFVSNIQNSAYNYRLMSNIIELADSSGIRVCCEGVETEEELATLEELRPSLLQGFLFSKPCEPEQFEDIYINPDGKGYRERIEREQLYRGKSKQLSDKKPAEWTKDEIMQSIIEEEKDIVYVSDVDTYEMYYLNPSGQKIFGVRGYRGKKCYKVLQGKNEPCAFCTNNVLRTDAFYI